MATLLGSNRVGGVRLRAGRAGPVRESTRSFLVQAEAGDTEDAIIEATGLRIGSLTVYGIVKSIDANFRPERLDLWDVVIDFSTEVEDGNEEDPERTDPTEWIPIYRTKFERLVEQFNTDASGDPVVNSAGVYIPQGITRTRYIPIWDVYQFEPPSVKDETILDRNEVVNENKFRGKAAKTLLCTVVQSEIGFYYGRKLRFTQYEIRYNKKTWQVPMADLGTQYLDTGVLKDFIVKGGELKLGGLDGSGAPAGGVVDGFPVDGEPAILFFDQFPTADFKTFLRG